MVSQRKIIYRMKIKKKEGEILQNLGGKFLDSTNVRNPIDKLSFNELEKETKKYSNSIFTSYTNWIFLLVVVLLSSSILLNKFLLKNLDPVVIKSMATTKSFFTNYLKKPYVLTIGEYENFDVAKGEAIKLLPEFKYIDIKELKGGPYTFEIERFSSKRKAYEVANKFMYDGYDAVHVRYQPDQ